ncbi:PAZ domain, partial [Trinorchestia longiramus]
GRFNGTCNWLRLLVDTKKTVYEYAVFFEPDIDARNLRFQLLSNLKDQLGNTKSFDGARLWLPERLKDKNTDLYTTHTITGERVRVRVELKHRTSMADCVQLYNVLFMRVLRQLQMTKVGMNYYLPGEKFLVPQYK